MTGSAARGPSAPIAPGSFAPGAAVRAPLVTRLADAIARHVAPGMHLHLASTPSRSNAAIRELARAFAGTRPGFTLSATGFHSTAHLLPMLGLADRLIGCFFGDHYPAPRPNALYTRLAEAGVELEHWPLWSMVASFRAGAQGDGWVVNRSLPGTAMARALAARGAYLELPPPVTGTVGEPRPIALCAALRPDVTFIHAPVADEDGHVLLTGPLSEGPWSALAARRGVIATVERVVPAAVTRAHPGAIALPPHRVLAICEEPFGAHPQPLHAADLGRDTGVASYRDDFTHYEHWRALTGDPDAFAGFVARVLRAADPAAAYRAYVGEAELAALRSPARLAVGTSGMSALAPAPRASAQAVGAVSAPAPRSGASAPRTSPAEPHPDLAATDALIVAGARQLAARAQALGARVLIAGIGHAFFAARLAQIQLARAGVALRVMVETGLYDVDCGPDGHGYLLAYDNLVRARRLTAIDDILGVLACGADNRCLAALGAAQIDRHGNLNSTRLGGKLLVGSGGACDIAASVEEVVVLTRLVPGRLVDEVEYLTSPGHGVRSVVTDRCVLTRGGTDDEAWTIAALASPGAPGGPPPGAPATSSSGDLLRATLALGAVCPWRLVPAADLGFAAAISTEEARLLDTLDPTGMYRHRAG